jgi:polysaccharide pyruvyl transferase WcaK-like protein
MNARQVAVLDTSIASENTGDQIIVEAVNSVLKDLFPDAHFVTVPTHERLFLRSLRLIRDSDLAFVAGTNLLASNMRTNKQWRIGLLESLLVEDLVLFGAGWWQYQDPPDRYTRILLDRVLSEDWTHSVRDAYTEKMLGLAGVEDVMNTSCPTLWPLDDVDEEEAMEKGQDVVFTLTCYNKAPEHDKHLVRGLLQSYGDVAFWPQQSGDLEYLSRLVGDAGREIDVLSPHLRSYDSALEEERDYVGTRLHAGIRALTKGNRALIVAIDNRAAEIGEDTGLPTVGREEGEKRLLATIRDPLEVDIRLPGNRIEAWKAQFGGGNA